MHCLRMGEILFFFFVQGGKIFVCCRTVWRAKRNWHMYVEGTDISLGTVAMGDPKQHLNLPSQKSSL